MEYLKYENIWITKCIYEDAETKYYENLAKASVTPLAGEVAKARQLLIESRESFKDTSAPEIQSIDPGAIKFLEKKTLEFEKSINTILSRIEQLDLRLSKLEKQTTPARPLQEGKVTSTAKATATVKPNASKLEDDDDVDLFASDSEGEDEAAAKIREERLAAYNAKKSKKPALIAKSNVILDVKPWDDETDMKELENQVRKISSEGLLWGAAKLVPLAYGIHKLQISCVVEDDKVSIDWLQDEITAIEDYVQSVDIAAFNKI
ncbi:hypothetical protein Zmor_003249 [Zophobas morio]|uniref:Elongation factor 1-delta n=1 Tax=Zophobas morio TaxID=2755281 RepID=A0AA38M1C6_9CUCU|nr:hypothetical protein Zmor_003209 [Zophobas morio]KAJ3639921.1 hypothetical protein Zmor_003249 [Zophobas morio]